MPNPVPAGYHPASVARILGPDRASGPRWRLAGLGILLATLEESSVPPNPVIATIPRVTGFFRAGLLSAKMASRDATVEKRNFESNPHLKHGCDKKYPPVLFHKRIRKPTVWRARTASR